MAKSTPPPLGSPICLLIKLLLLLNILLLNYPVYAVKVAIEEWNYSNKVYAYIGKVTLTEPYSDEQLATMTTDAAKQMVELVGDTADTQWPSCPHCMAGFWAENDPKQVYFHSSVKGLKKGEAFVKVYSGNHDMVNEAIKTAIDKCSEENGDTSHKNNGNCAEVMVINWWATEHGGIPTPGTKMKIVTVDKHLKPKPACGNNDQWGCKQFLAKLQITECPVPTETGQKRKRGLNRLQEGRIFPRAPPAGKTKQSSGRKGKSSGVNGVGTSVSTLTLGGSQSCPMPKKTGGKAGGGCPKGQKPIMNKDPKVRKGKTGPACAPEKQGAKPKKNGKEAQSKKKGTPSKKKEAQSKKKGTPSKKKEAQPKKKGTQSKKKEAQSKKKGTQSKKTTTGNRKVTPPPKKQQRLEKSKGGKA